jgi:hypothetical protein
LCSNHGNPPTWEPGDFRAAKTPDDVLPVVLLTTDKNTFSVTAPTIPWEDRMPKRRRRPALDEFRERVAQAQQGRSDHRQVPAGLAEHFTLDEWAALSDAAEAAGLEQEQIIHRWVMHRR